MLKSYPWCYYNATNITFKDDVFVVFNNLINFWNETLSLVWVRNLTCPNIDFVRCVFHGGIKLVWLHMMIIKYCKWIHFLLHCMGTTFGNCEGTMFWSNILVFLWVTLLIPILWTHDSHGNCLSTLMGESWCKIKLHPSSNHSKRSFCNAQKPWVYTWKMM
jgi:hypothetical protein